MKTFPFCFPFFVFQVCQLSSERSSDARFQQQARTSCVVYFAGLGIRDKVTRFSEPVSLSEHLLTLSRSFLSKWLSLYTP